jgi:DoxX-like family
VITTTARVTAREARPRRLASTLLWGAQIVLAAFFLFGAAGPKLAGSHSMVKEFGLIGAGQWFRYLVGTAELAGAIGLLAPWFAGLAAAGLAADMARRDHRQRHGAAQHHIRRQRLDDRGAVRRVRAHRLRPAAADHGPGGSHPSVKNASRRARQRSLKPTGGSLTGG